MSTQLSALVLILLSYSLFLITIVLVYLIYLFKIKSKKELIKWYIAFSFSMLIWVLGSFLMVIDYKFTGSTNDIYVNLSLTGLIFFSIPFFFSGIVYANSHIKIKKRFYLLFIFPVILTVLTWTNEVHHLMYLNYDVMLSGVEIGPLFIFNQLFQYLFVFLGLIWFLSSSIKNSGFFSKQSILIFIASLLPLLTSIIFHVDRFDYPTNITSISLSFSMMCLLLALFKYEFLKILPIALKQIVNHISDSYVVIDNEERLIDFNRAFENNFGIYIRIKRKVHISEIIDKLITDSKKIYDYFQNEERKRKSFSFETYMKKNKKYYLMEITPIKIRSVIYVGTIIIFKDITDQKNYIENINRSQSIMMEKERLASLGQFIGGIAHNLRTPIMSLSGSVQALDDLVTEYEESISDTSVNTEDHYDIANDMNTWIKKMRPTILYISDVISAVKGQAMSPEYSTERTFRVSDLLKRLEILMDHELRLNNCNLKITNKLEIDEEIFGDITCLIQIFNNIIINAADVYGEKGGIIDVNVEKKGVKILFSVKDYGKGISKEVQDKIFSEMVTTKGMKGTGLGLYMSYSNIKARFNGNMYYKTKQNEGTTFYVKV
ncbi:MAG: histidine kinase N-terminal 7TM domain-containing protein [Clostridiales bacterium]